MDIIEAIRSRKSIRGYKSDPVPKEILREILDIATRSPSAMNTQPWEITVVAEKVLDNIKQGVVEMLNAGATPTPEIPHRPFEGEYRRRQVDLAINIFNLMGITREDGEKRAAWMQRGLCFFDAPATIILSMDKSLNESIFNILDIGAIAQTICLTALNYGLGTCIEDQGIMFSEVVRRFTGIPESKLMIVCIAIGYPDWDFPANKLETVREPLENIVTWCNDD
ncbi:nitroreductase [Chloroflexota bacterium]